jgi:hypothetical protein
MMRVGGTPVSPLVAPPGPSPAPAAVGSPAPAAVAEALFKEARRRRRRRWLAVLAASLVLAAAAAIGFSAIRAPRQPASGAARTGPASTAHGGVAPGTSVAWVDYNGRLHLGDLATGTQRVVAGIDAYPAQPLSQVGSHIYWVDQAGTYVPALGHWSEVVRELDLASGRIRVVGPGQSVFPATDGRHVFISRTDTSLVEVPVTGSGAPHPLTLSPGWFVPYGQGIGLANGILVQSADRAPVTRARTFGVWNPRSRRVRAVGRDYQVIDAVSPPGARSSLLAWVPESCVPAQDCLMRITSAQTLSTRTVRSPLRHGFADGGAFSPDGTQLAVFVNLNGEPSAAQLAMVDTRTGTLRLVPGARTQMGEPVSWARWLPDGRHLLAGGLDASYLVNPSTMTARPMFFIHGPDHYIEASEDLNYSAVVVPLRQ